MNFNIKKYIKTFEGMLFKGYNLNIFKGHRASDKRGAEKIIDELYQNLEQDVQRAKDNLNK